MTAHDFEDMVQVSVSLPIDLTSVDFVDNKCAIPVFEGLLPEPHNTRILKLLFNLAHWHGLAKLRMHTDPTLDLLSPVTTSLSNSLREFDEKTCALFQTQELERERAARQRRQEKATTNNGAEPRASATGNKTRKPKHLNLKTYKYHALGDYVTTIRRFGTTDSYSTQPVSLQSTAYPLALTIDIYQSELEHKISKARFIRTSGRSIPEQISKIELRQRRIRMIREKMHRPNLHSQNEPDDLINDPRAQYNMGKTQKSPVHVPTFLRKNDGDPAIKVVLTISFSKWH